MARGRAGQRSRASTRRPDPDRRSAAAPPATDTSSTPPAVPTAADRPRHVATDIPAADPRRQPRRPARRPILTSPAPRTAAAAHPRSEEHTSELQSRQYLVCRLLLEKKKTT